MRVCAATVLGIAGVLAVLVAGPVRADPTAEQVRKVREAVSPSTVIVSFNIERDDGEKMDARLLGVVVGEGGLVMFSSAAIPSQFPITQFRDFRVVVTKGNDLQELDAEYLGKDDQSQVAFLKVTAAGAPALPVLAFDEKAKVDIGDPVVSFDNLGEPDGYARAMQLGRVAARIEQPVVTYLCTGDLGLPGTPVLTLDGKVVGIVGFVRLNRGTNARPKFGVLKVIWPVERFIERVKNPPMGGKIVKHPWLGVQTLTPVTKDLAEYFKLGDRRGVVVGQIIEKSPAAKAGLKAEDVILALNGKNITGTEGQLVENFGNDIRQRKIDEEITLEVWRAGKTEQVKVMLAQQPKGAAEADRYREKKFGLTVRELVLEDCVSRELPSEETGVVVAFLDPAGWAQDAGLQPGDIIKKVQDKDTPTLEAFKKLFGDEVAKKPKEIVMFVLRGKKDTQLVRIEPRWDAAEKPKAPETPAAPETPKAPEGK